MPKDKIDTNKDENSIGANQMSVVSGGADKVIAEVAKKEVRPETKIVPMEQLVTFELDKEEYASIITDLREVIRIPEITPIPGAPEFIRGILNLRGQIVMVIDLEKRFHLKREHPTEPKHIIIAEVEDSVFGITVDEVTGVLRVPHTSIKSTPQLTTSKIHADYLKGVVILESKDDESNKTIKQKNAKTKKQENENKEVEAGSRLLLLLDIPKMLAEKELLDFGNVIQEVTKQKVG
jgi:purine-binding chemotaxis protein CheW